jgi:plastocyanin
MHRPITGLLAAAGFAVVAIAFSGCSDTPPGDVIMSGQAFEPEEFTISVGETVTWAYSSGGAHTVTAYADEFPEGADYFASGGASDEEAARDNVSDGLLSDSDTFEVAFDVPGTYRYFCLPHETVGMTGTIIVEP